MGKKKLKTGKKGKKRVIREDVEASTGIPPMVDGQIRCFLRVSVSKILWMTTKPIDITHVKLKWWGEQSEGTIFRPNDVKNPHKSLSRTTARYGIRAGPKQFSAYVHDMGPLVFEILSGSTMNPVGYARIYDIGALIAPGKPLNGFFPVYSIDVGEKKIGELQISIVFEPLMATFDSCSSVPTTDMSLDAKGSSDMEMMQPPVPNIHPKEHLVSLQSTDKEVKSRPILTGVDDEYSFVVGPGRTESPTNITVQSPVKEERMSVNDSPVKDVNIQRKQRVVQDGRIQHKQDDVLSSLLDRGTKLRTEMIKSEIVTDQLTANSTKAQNGTDISLTEFTHRRDRTSSTGDLFKEILDVDNEGSMDDLESGVIHLVVGDNLDEKELNILRKLQGDRSLESSFSSTHDSILSDVNDPLHDSSIIEELFYKEAVLTDSESDLSDVESKLSISRSMSIDDPSNVRPPSRKSSLKSIDTPVKLSAASGGDSDSESEVVSVSRVSFDSTHIDEQDTAFEVNGISVERLALLEKVHISRVTVDTLKLESPVIPVKRKSHSKGKPPRPSKSIKTMTYFVEYKFPVAAPTRDDGSENTMATEVMRIVSKKVSSDGVVTFSHRSVFPVSFDSDVIDKWCKRLLVFKIFSRTSGQKSPTLIGVCSIPLLSVITSSDLIINADLNINDKNLPSTSSELACPTDTDSKPHVGQLKVSIELASDEKDFIASLASTKISELKRGTAIAPITNPPIMSASQEKSPVHPKEIESKIPEEKVQPYVPAYEPLTLHSLLMIPEGKDITLHGVRSHKTSNRIPQPAPPTKLGIIGKSGRDLTVRNTYLLCRTFWSNDVVRSSVCWGTSQPHYDFVQVAPVLLTNALLERTKNNFMVVEVWDKKTSAEDDKLIGIVKLSLHQFYMSFRDRRIASTLLKSQYPVVSVDTLLPIVDPFTGKQHGKLNVTLALGSNEQVAALEQIKFNEESFQKTGRPEHYLERRCISDERNIFSERDTNTESYVEHVFEVVVEGISNQPQMDNTVWAEADCFVQYHFPSQHSIQQGTVTSYRTGTTLCLPNSLFNDVKKHRIILPSRSPIQRELLAACGGVGGGSGGIPFEVWHRYYHPNVRDQVVAKGLLPLTKLCAMVTMQKIGGSSMQSYSLPLISHIADQQHPTQELKDKSAGNGFIDITIKYQSLSAGKSEGLKYSPASEAANQEVGSQICISISVLRACGLKTAAKLAAKQDSRIQYASDVGINAYVKVNLSFHNKESERITRTVARSFAPDFSHHMDFPCSLLCRETGLSLAELMETGQVTLQVWHQVTVLRSEHDVPISQHSNIFGSPNDVLLASTAVPLQDLLSNRTGIKGWFPLNSPDDSCCHGNGLHPSVGGIEIDVQMARSSDREKVIHNARDAGWSPLQILPEVQSSDSLYEVTVNVDYAIIPETLTHVSHQNTVDRYTSAYVRYQFYDKATECSTPHTLTVSEKGYRKANLKHKHSYICQSTEHFMCYLQEETVEIQLWLNFNSGKTADIRPKQEDKLIGCSYVKISDLRQYGVSGLFPIYKCGAVEMDGACLRVHLFMQPCSSVPDINKKTSDEAKEYDLPLVAMTKTETKHHDPVLQTVVLEETEKLKPIKMKIEVERAMHLPRVNENSSEINPSSYVTYNARDQTFSTDVINCSDCPVWNHCEELEITRNDIENNSLVFKMWHRSPSNEITNPDKVLGFVSVDLDPLLAGLKEIYGWYNIMDFTGQCQGQIKVGISPQDSVSPLKSKPQTVMQQAAAQNKFSGSVVYDDFPSHLVQYPEVSIKLSQRSTHYAEHFENIKKYHENLQDQKREMRKKDIDKEPHHFSFANDSTVSTSFLFRNLRSQMKGLDELQRTMQDKLKKFEPASIHESSAAPPPHFEINDSYKSSPSLSYVQVCDSNNENAPLNQMDETDVWGDSPELIDGEHGCEVDVIIPKSLNDISSLNDSLQFAESSVELPAMDNSYNSANTSDELVPWSTDAGDESVGISDDVQIQDAGLSSLGTGTIDTGAVEPVTIDTGAMDSETTDTGALDPETTDTGAMDPEMTDTGAMDPETTDTGAMDPETTDTGAMDPETTDTDTMDVEKNDTGAMDTETINTGTIEIETKDTDTIIKTSDNACVYEMPKEHISENSEENHGHKSDDSIHSSENDDNDVYHTVQTSNTKRVFAELGNNSTSTVRKEFSEANHEKRQNSRACWQEYMTHGKTKLTPTSEPHFFLPAEDLESNMKELCHSAPLILSRKLQHNERKLDKSQIPSQRHMLAKRDKTRPHPTAEDTKRIANIFSTKF